MLVLVKTSVACLLFMIYMIGFYYRKPHIPIKSTKIFQCLIAVALVNASFDLITICTVNRRDVISNTTNLTVHVIYLLSILGYIYFLFLYMRSYLEVNLKFSRVVRIFHSLPGCRVDCGNYRITNHLCSWYHNRLFFRPQGICALWESGDLSDPDTILLSPLLEDYGWG